MKTTEKRNLEYLQLLESLEVMLMNGNSINPDSVIRNAIQVAIGKDVNQNKMKQTAVQWLENEFKEAHKMFGGIDTNWIKRFEQAKEMERQQIMTAFTQGDIFGADYYDGVNITEENYYNQTFKSE